MYQRSLGINVNIIMGIIMLVFGFGLLLFVRKKKKNNSRMILRRDQKEGAKAPSYVN